MREKFTGFNFLLFHYIKRDFKKSIFWILGVGIFAGGFVPAFEELGKGQGLVGMFETMKNPAMIFLVGFTPIKEAAKYTIGSMYSHEMLLFTGIISMIVSGLHIINHTRKEEDLGLTEMVRSFKVGRLSNTLAVVMETVFINIVLSIFIFFLMISFNVDTITGIGALIFGLSIGLAGIIGGFLALLFAQLMPSSSSATGLTLGLLGLLYILRGITDISNIRLSHFNPLGWIYLTFPFVENNIKFLLFGLVFTIFILIISFILEGNRDMGSGYISEREGKGFGKKSLLSVNGFLRRINRGTIIAWSISFLILGVAYGSIYGDMQMFLDSNDLVKTMFTHTGISLEESFTSTIILVMIMLVAVLPMTIINRLYTEEKMSRLSQIYSTKISRRKIYWTNILLALISGIIGILLSSIGLGGVAISLMEGSSMGIMDFILAGYNYLSVIIFFIGLSSFLLGFIPEIGKIAYIYLGYSFIMNYFKDLLDLPDILLNTSIHNWIPKMPMEDFDLKVFLIISIMGIVLAILGDIGYKKRDLKEGA